ncbi:hypothetical protein ACWDX6_04350 [Streptomyces sp. NPDC003027]
MSATIDPTRRHLIYRWQSTEGRPAATIAFNVADIQGVGKHINVARFPHPGTGPWVTGWRRQPEKYSSRSPAGRGPTVRSVCSVW